MQTTTYTGKPGFRGDAAVLGRRLFGPALLAGLLGGLAMIVVMILVMGAAGMGYATLSTWGWRRSWSRSPRRPRCCRR